MQVVSMPSNYSKPAIYLPFDVLYLICTPLNQHDRLSFLGACYDWYTTGYPLILDSLDFKIPILGQLFKYNYTRRWDTYYQAGILPKSLHIADPVHKIYSPIDKLFDSVTRINKDLPSIFLIPPSLLSNIRRVHIDSQLVNVCGRAFWGNGVRHSWAYDMIPYLLQNCPFLDDIEVEIEPVFYEYSGTFGQSYTYVLPRERSINVRNLLMSEIISSEGEVWAGSRASWLHNSPNRDLRLWREDMGDRVLSRFSIGLKGHSYRHAVDSMRYFWRILVLGLLGSIKELEIKNVQTFVGFGRIGNWFSMAAPAYPASAVAAQTSKITKLSLESGDHHQLGFPKTLNELKEYFPNLDHLTLSKAGIWVFDPCVHDKPTIPGFGEGCCSTRICYGRTNKPKQDMGFLSELTNLKTLEIHEKTSPELDAEVGPDSIHTTSQLLSAMQLLLLPPKLKTMKWNRGGRQLVHCETLWVPDIKRIESVDVWLTVEDQRIFEGERYGAWDFHQELYHGLGPESEEKWGYQWMRRFSPESEGTRSV
ncbi:hypothetical protein AOL_s00006g273 [Orbilia oligospora ATCC 24927]|uniref:Uncharacterized protein n=1 Tax=Arthrobotrys oligospora (strain ATCC 24927 / CBS 115.81 / DSM 1491) TaxID=756982 RepID=G1X072_ARTOA|nr:hypothetical protein AOL_s00006g273 [Orbilia oligospora ATCC 24927]EGX53407.1 hypothetical protein AOL_s00006g273 [Orbilia oligospora ATCC 24927]